MRFRSIHLSLAALALAIILVLAAVVGGFLLMNEFRTGGMQPKWTFSEKSSYNADSEGYQVMFVDKHGIILASEYQHAVVPNDSWIHFVALNPDGSLRWRVGVNGYPSLSQGADGGYYYVDQIENGFANSPQRQLFNLTYLDASGDYKWSYHVANGTIDVWATYPDGEVIINHYKETQDSGYNATTGKYDNLTNEIIALSSSGQEMWNASLVSGGEAIWASYHFNEPNGTFLLYTHDNVSYKFGFDRITGSSFKVQVDHIPIGYYDGDSPESLRYGFITEYLSNFTTVTSAYAGYLNNGSDVWKTTLFYSYDNPNGYSNGTRSWTQAVVDGKGQIYYESEARNFYALTSNGVILWSMPAPGWIIADFAGGGLLVESDRTLMKIGTDGSVAWRYDLGNYVNPPIGIALGPDDTVYIGQSDSVLALAHSSFSNNLVWLSIMLLADLIAIGCYFF